MWNVGNSPDFNEDKEDLKKQSADHALSSGQKKGLAIGAAGLLAGAIATEGINKTVEGSEKPQQSEGVVQAETTADTNQIYQAPTEKSFDELRSEVLEKDRVAQKEREGVVKELEQKVKDKMDSSVDVSAQRDTPLALDSTESNSDTGDKEPIVDSPNQPVTTSPETQTEINETPNTIDGNVETITDTGIFSDKEKQIFSEIDQNNLTEKSGSISALQSSLIKALEKFGSSERTIESIFKNTLGAFENNVEALTVLYKEAPGTVSPDDLVEVARLGDEILLSLKTAVSSFPDLVGKLSLEEIRFKELIRQIFELGQDDLFDLRAKKALGLPQTNLNFSNAKSDHSNKRVPDDPNWHERLQKNNFGNSSGGLGQVDKIKTFPDDLTSSRENPAKTKAELEREEKRRNFFSPNMRRPARGGMQSPGTMRSSGSMQEPGSM